MKFLSWERRHCADPTDRRHYKGSQSEDSSNSPVTTVTNTDRRLALQDAIAIGDGGYGSFSTSTNTTNIDASQRNFTDASQFAATDARSWTDSSDRSFTDASDRSFTDNSRFAATDARSWSDSSRNTDARSWTDNSVTYAADAAVLRTLASEMPDAVKFMTQAGADVIREAGGSVVDLNRDSMNANRLAFDAVVNMGAATVDKLIDASVRTTEAGATLAGQAVQSFQPTENKQSDALKWGAIAAAAAVAAIILKGAK